MWIPAPSQCWRKGRTVCAGTELRGEGRRDAIVWFGLPAQPTSKALYSILLLTPLHGYSVCVCLCDKREKIYK